jgi:hypothetical protein
MMTSGTPEITPIGEPITTPGIYGELPFAGYRDIEALRYGQLRAVSKCPVKANHPQGDDRRWLKDSNRIANGVHCAILEPARFDDYRPKAGCYGGKGTCKNIPVARSFGEWYCKDHLADDDVDKDAPSTCVEEEINTCKAVAKAFGSHDGVRSVASLVPGGWDNGWEREVSILWEHSTGQWCKCRPDALSVDRRYVFDLKTTTSSAHPFVVAKSALGSGYIHQAAFTRMGLRSLGYTLDRYFLITLEIREPYCLSVCEVLIDDIDSAEEELSIALTLWEKCAKSERWPGYDGIHPLRLPESAWADPSESQTVDDEW